MPSFGALGYDGPRLEDPLTRAGGSLILSRRQVIHGCLAGALGLAMGSPLGVGMHGAPRGSVATIGTWSTQVVPATPGRIGVRLLNASRRYNVYVTEGRRAWLRHGQLLRPGEQLLSDFPGAINAIVEAYGYHLATADVIVGPP